MYFFNAQMIDEGTITERWLFPFVNRFNRLDVKVISKKALDKAIRKHGAVKGYEMLGLEIRSVSTKLFDALVIKVESCEDHCPDPTQPTKLTFHLKSRQTGEEKDFNWYFNFIKNDAENFGAVLVRTILNQEVSPDFNPDELLNKPVQLEIMEYPEGFGRPAEIFAAWKPEVERNTFTQQFVVVQKD